MQKGNPTRVRFLAVAGLAIGFAALFPESVSAAENISGFVDSAGRVVFVNEAAESSANAAASKATAFRETGPGNRKLLAKTALPAESPGAAALAAESTATLGGSNSPRNFAPENSPPVPRGRDYIAELVSDAARRHQVDAELVHAIVRVESNYNPYALSNKGARGLMQLIPATARRFGVLDSFDPRSNLDGGIRYLKYLMGLFNGDLRLSLAAYNAGEMAVTRSGGVPPYRETQNYIRKISELYSMSTVAAAAGVAPEQQIIKYVDDSGVVHFSNTDMP